MILDFKELPDWLFEVEEVSIGVYRISGRDRAGRSVEATGIDPDNLLERCKSDALQVVNAGAK